MQTDHKHDVLIMGSGVAAVLAAAYFHKFHPDIDIAVAGRSSPRGPVVGESLVEVSTKFLQDLGLAPMLIEKHYPKYALTYYYKVDLDNPADRRYMVSEAPYIPPFPSFQLNRFTFDEDVRQHNIANGVPHIESTISGVEVGSNGTPHVVEAEDADGNTHRITARFLVDATGRSRLVGRSLGLTERLEPRAQRNVFWLRLADFDESLLRDLPVVKKRNDAYDPYFVTHHFFGVGNWIWLIPMRSDAHRNLISIGIIYRPDLYPHDVRTLDDFMSAVAAEHPVVTELVRSGTVSDTNVYRNYMYAASRHYSTDGWFLLGDAADTVDPLYSVGLALTAVQITQVAEMVRRGMAGTLDEETTRALDDAFVTFHRAVTEDITQLYEIMDKPLQCALSQHLGFLTSFHIGAPFIYSGYLTDPKGAALWNTFAHSELVERGVNPMNDLIARVAERGSLDLASQLPRLQTPRVLNYGYYEHLREEDMAASIADMYLYLAGFRLRLLRSLGFEGLTWFSQHLQVLREVASAIGIRVLLGGRRVRDVRWVQRLVERRMRR